MNRVLILGAGLMQEPAIDSAHELGFQVTVFDGNAHAYCKDKCDSFEVIDLKHTDLLVKRALEIHSQTPFSAIFTAGTDFSFAVASVAKACSLPAHSIEAAKNASDKIIMRTCFQKDSVPSPKYIEVTDTTSPDILTCFISSITFPIVVKPCDNMGARGCRLARNQDELDCAIKDAISFSKTKRAIVEEYMEGPEFSIDALVYNNEVTITGFADRHIFYPPFFIEMGHSMPTNIDTENYTKIIKTFVAGIRSLGLTHGAAKADIKLTKDGPMVGEIAARLSGGYMSGWTFPYASGLNLTKQALLIALKKEPKELYAKRNMIMNDVSGFAVYDYPCEKHCVERAWLSIPGKVQTVNFADTQTIQECFPRLSSGDIAVFPVNNVQKAGNVICVADSRKDAEDAAMTFITNTLVQLESDYEDTNMFLSQDVNTDFPPSAYNVPHEIFSQICNLRNIPFSGKLEIPVFLSEYTHQKDWNARTLENSISLLNKCIQTSENCINNDTLDLSKIWVSLLRGGVQGALYYLF